MQKVMAQIGLQSVFVSQNTWCNGMKCEPRSDFLPSGTDQG